ncbi:MAG: tellurite resistance/C4-dicarboxylate transporter family protein [Burkholderiales bacterium]|nr:tellurite resistance/C4-dicarboxylate transporter family protein [Burkholderiales bacterium]MDE1928579.1 tellurite resistance/C4-dicarboxylate transporter family protein [Burkholderiales bacterium]MDE2158596.1 tellurite resistance/C4-dicarboxylate transporter family protein [Burkholderiales bacterium]MDE2503287.1 tellurite resistance/C4-dicarboxylate transporter family protein [Burkholderiales bacterium]
MCMATGIVSIAARQLGLATLARALFGLNVAVYGLLWLLYAARLIRYPRRFAGDLIDHLRGPGFFTTVAASRILGSQFLLLAGSVRGALALWLLAIALWLGRTYAVFAAFTVKTIKPPLDHGINGGWLLAVVATQSIALLSALLAAHADQPHRLELNFFALSMSLWSGMFYIWMIALIFYRYTFFPFRPRDLTPPYWINMGAMAISTLAGSQLGLNAADAPFLHALRPFIDGFTIFYWATVTWWIPMLLVLGVWHCVCRRRPLRYDPLFWGAVFPLGMYAASTFEMARALGLGFLDPLPKVFFGLALLAWTAAFVGVLRALVALAAGRTPRLP